MNEPNPDAPEPNQLTFGEAIEICIGDAAESLADKRPEHKRGFAEFCGRAGMQPKTIKSWIDNKTPGLDGNFDKFLGFLKSERVKPEYIEVLKHARLRLIKKNKTTRKNKTRFVDSNPNTTRDINIYSIISRNNQVGQSEYMSPANKNAEISESASRKILEFLSKSNIKEDNNLEVIRHQVEKAVEDGNYDLAISLVTKSEGECNSSIEQYKKSINDTQRRLGYLYSAHGEIENARLNYMRAAEFFAKAAGCWPEIDKSEEMKSRRNQAIALYNFGFHRGDAAHIEAAIEVYIGILDENLIDDDPLELAATKSRLGLAYRALGEWQGSSQKLNEAKVFFEDSAGIYTKKNKSEPSSKIIRNIARVQNNLGLAIVDLGDLEEDVAQFHDAEAIFTEAINQFERDCDPLHWTMMRNNLALTWKEIGEREGNSESIMHAIGGFEKVLESYSKIIAEDSGSVDQRVLQQASLGKNRAKINHAAAIRVLGDWSADAALLEEAIEELEEVLNGTNRHSMPLDLAYAKDNLGLAYRAIAMRRNDPELLAAAITAFNESSEHRTRKRVPRLFAQTQFNVGLVYRTFGRRNRDASLLTKAAEAFRTAAESWEHDKIRVKWAEAQSKLASVHHLLGEQSGDMENLNLAINTFEDAVREISPNKRPLQWAEMANDLGNSYRLKGYRTGDLETLEKAIDSYKKSLNVRTRNRVPLKWASTKNNLGKVFFILGQQEKNIKYLEKAVEAFEDALEELPRKYVPMQWSGAKNNLGIAMQAIGEIVSDERSIEKALAAFKEALPERSSLDWACTLGNVGNALAALGKIEGGTVRLEEAVDTYKEALAGTSLRDRAPLDWASIQNNLGVSLRILGRRTQNTSYLEDAKRTYELSLLERKRGFVPMQWAQTKNNLGTVLADIGMKNRDLQTINNSIAAFVAAASVWEIQSAQFNFASNSIKLGRSFKIKGIYMKEAIWFDQAVEAFGDALLVYRQDIVPLQWAHIQQNIGHALKIKASLTDNDDERKRSKAAFVEALKIYEAIDESELSEGALSLIRRLRREIK